MPRLLFHSLCSDCCDGTIVLTHGSPINRILERTRKPARPIVASLAMLPRCAKRPPQAKTQVSSAHLTDAVNFLYTVNSIHKRTNGDSPG